MIKKILLSLFIAIVALISFSSITLGQTDPDPSIIIDDKEDFITIAKSIATWVYRLFFVIAVFYILLAAFTYLTAKDDASKVKKAQDSLKNAVIAIVIALISTGASLLITQFITP